MLTADNVNNGFYYIFISERTYDGFIKPRINLNLRCFIVSASFFPFSEILIQNTDEKINFFFIQFSVFK